MSTRAAILLAALTVGAAWTTSQAQQRTVPPPLETPDGGGTPQRHPLGDLRNAGWVRNRHLPDHQMVPGDNAVPGGNLRPDWHFQDSDASSTQAREDNAGGMTPTDPWLPSTSGDRPPTRRDAVRALRNAVRDAIARSTEIDETILSFSPFRNESRSSADSSSSSGSPEDRVRFRVGVSHLAPKVEMRCGMGGGALGLSVSAFGEVHIDLAPSRAGGIVQAGLDPVDGRYDIGYRLTF